jgi:hypothetical protein
MPHCERYLLTIRVTNSPYWGVCTIKRLRAIIGPDAQRSQLRGDLTSGSKSELIALIGVVIMNYAASDPKDYVYGTGGMSTLRIAADYSSATAVGDVYQEFAAHWLAWDHRAKGEIRSNIIGLEELCNLWFLERAGIGYPWESYSGMTSWAPNFAGVAKYAYERKHISTMRSLLQEGVGATLASFRQICARRHSRALSYNVEPSSLVESPTSDQ